MISIIPTLDKIISGSIRKIDKNNNNIILNIRSAIKNQGDISENVEKIYVRPNRPNNFTTDFLR